MALQDAINEVKAWLNNVWQPFKWTTGNTSAHSGMDFGMPIGTPIYALHSGQIIFSGQKPWGGQISEGETAYGKPMVDSFLHLSREVVAAGQNVAAGQLIGYSGEPPPGGKYGSGAHLHFEETMGGLAPYVSAIGPTNPTSTNYPINPLPLLQTYVASGGGTSATGQDSGPQLPGIDLSGITQAINDLASNIGTNVTTQVGNIIGTGIKNATGTTSVKDFGWRAFLIITAFALLLIGIVIMLVDFGATEIGKSGVGSTVAIA